MREANLTSENTFADVTEDAWYNVAVSTLAGMGIIKGYSADSFQPNQIITRAELAAMCARFDQTELNSVSSFTDIKGHWAEKEIEKAAALGWVRGYEDGSFHQDQTVTRAEAVSVFNRVLGREPAGPEDLLEGMITFRDNADPSKWYFVAIQEATNSHTYYTDKFGEHWVELIENPDWQQYQ